MDSLPQMEKDVEMLYSIDGQPPDLRNLPPGCRFAPRCANKMEVCEKEYPSQVEYDENHTYSCWLKEGKG
jgi:oligopeptide/dipeptide ABC transporter ATP-binding protein